MKSKKMKQALALLCAGAMTVTGMNLPVNVMSTDAAAECVKNGDRRERERFYCHSEWDERN